MDRIQMDEVLDVFCWGLDKFMRPTLVNLLSGYEEYEHSSRSLRVTRHLERHKWISRTGRGKNATFAITADGRRQVAPLDVAGEWERPWDGCWRVVIFDLPEAQRRQRFVLWQALRARHLGLLQRSVWIWPHDLQSALQEIVHAEGVPDCFCGFETRRLFLCTDAEVVSAAWDFAEIQRRQEGYLDGWAKGVRVVEQCQTLSALAKTARAERMAYQYAFSLDPLLPRVLWPKSYRGTMVADRHRQFRQALARRLRDLAGVK